MPDYVVRQRLPHRAGAAASCGRAFAFAINEDEVDAAFEVPLRFLMDPANHMPRQPHLEERRSASSTTMPYGERRIWGVTAGIIRTLYERLYA